VVKLKTLLYQFISVEECCCVIGAGISASAGLPTFRGLDNKDKAGSELRQLFHIQELQTVGEIKIHI
jgi:NAD-dependent SIR2 family protein deacetylase